MNDQQRAAMIRPRGKSVFPQMVEAYKAMKMALEALEDGLWDYGPGQDEHDKCNEVITALREALAQPQDNLNCKSVQARLATSWGYVKEQPQGEWVDLTVDEIAGISDYLAASNNPSDIDFARAIIGYFTEKNTPPVVPQGEWVDLTDDDFNASFKKHPNDFARAVIAKFKEKNTPPVVPQEPVAWQDPKTKEVCRAEWLANNARECDQDRFCIPLYTTLPSVEAAIEATKEKAAKVCEDFADKALDPNGAAVAVNLTAAIRSMK